MGYHECHPYEARSFKIPPLGASPPSVAWVTIACKNFVAQGLLFLVLYLHKNLKDRHNLSNAFFNSHPNLVQETCGGSLFALTAADGSVKRDPYN